MTLSAPPPPLTVVPVEPSCRNERTTNVSSSAPPSSERAATLWNTPKVSLPALPKIVVA